MKRKSKTQGFYMNVDGEPVHMLADSDMTEKELDLLENIVRAARKRMDAQTSKTYLCLQCKQNQTAAADGICTQCKIAGLMAK